MSAWRVGQVRAEAAGPLRVLHAAVERLDAEGRPAPCRVRPDLFVSESKAQRDAAAATCWTCPAFRPCQVYATTQREVANVWAGLDRSPKWTVRTS